MKLLAPTILVLDLVYGGNYVGMYDSNSVTLKHDWQINDAWSNTLLYRTTKEKHSWAKPGGEDPDRSCLLPATRNTSCSAITSQYHSDRYSMLHAVALNTARARTTMYTRMLPISSAGAIGKSCRI